jgi:hypothetical protein
VLDACAERGLRAIVCDLRARAWCGASQDGAEGFRRAYEAALRDFGGHPATFGFHFGDEPDARAFPDVCAAMRAAAALAPHLPPFLNLLPKHVGFADRVGFDTWSDYLDACCREATPPFLCYDCYGQLVGGDGRDEGIQNYFDNLRDVVTEWKDAQGRDYVSLVNNSQTEPAHVVLHLRGPKTRAYQVCWLGEERPAACRDRGDAVSTFFFTAPGQMELYRLESAHGQG